MFFFSHGAKVIRMGKKYFTMGIALHIIAGSDHTALLPFPPFFLFFSG